MLRSRFTIGCVLIAMLLGAGAPARGQPDPNSEEIKHSMSVVLGLLQYVRTNRAPDDSTTTEGGAEGSAILMRRYPALGHTDWYLIEGTHLYLNQPGFARQPVVYPRPDQQIAAVRTYRGGRRSPVFVADQRAVTEMLIDVYQSTQDTDGIALHAPALAGRGWLDDRGATWDEAQAVARDLDLALERAAESPAVGRVVAQEPAPGTALARGAPLRVRLDGQAVELEPVGTRQRPDRVLVVAAPEEPDAAMSTRTRLDTETAASGRISGRITSFHPDAIAVPDAPARPEYVARLSREAAGMLVTVSPAADESNDLLLSAWHDDGQSLRQLRLEEGSVPAGPQALIQFTAPRDGATLIVAEHRTRRLMSVELRVAWHAAGSAAPEPPATP